MTLKWIINNCLKLSLVALVFFVIHVYINKNIDTEITSGQIIYSYIINYLLACGVIVLLFLLKKKLKDQLGFIFMAASLLKFVFFFLLFYPSYKMDGDMTKPEFFTFFIPYAICLTIECIILSKFLNNLDKY